jgi:ABC-type antimicrobial peptide transport system permease subunit
VVGRQVWANGRKVEIVGVVKTAKYESLKEEPQIIVYLPVAQRLSGVASLYVRTHADPQAMLARLHGMVRAIDPKLAATSGTTLVAQRDGGISRERLLAFLSDFLGCLAAALVAVGLYGLVAYSVARRTGEVGVRLALGAQSDNIRWMFMRESVLVWAAGIAIGLPLALVSSRVLETIVFGVSPQDWLALGSGSVALLVISLIAALVPSWRGSRLDPMTALRYE